MFKKIVAMVAGAAAGLLGLMASAHAEIPTVVGTALTAVETDAAALRDLVIPIVVSVLGMMLVIKLIKRFGNKI